jgi:predicted dehydrogenase
VAEAKQVQKLVESVGLVHGYLEDQLFAPHVSAGHALLWARGAATTGRPYLARAAEEHSGPHTPWFWQGKLQGGGVLNDMMCHSALVVRHLLTKPGESLSTVKPVPSARTSPRSSGRAPSTPTTCDHGKAVDYLKAPSEISPRSPSSSRRRMGIA